MIFEEEFNKTLTKSTFIVRGYMLPDSSTESSTSIPYPLKLPISSRSLRSTFIETKTCLREHLPVPEVVMVKTEESKYSFTTLLECLTHFLAFGQGTENVVNDIVEDFNGSIPVTSTKDSRAKNERRKEALEIIKGKNNQDEY